MQPRDRTENPLIALDRRYTLKLLGPRPGERVLDAACGTGAHQSAISRRALTVASGCPLRSDVTL